MISPEEISPFDVITAVPPEEITLADKEEENVCAIHPANDDHLYEDQRSEEPIIIDDQRSEDYVMVTRSWINSPRRSNRISQILPDPNVDVMMNFNMTFALSNSCDDATKVNFCEGISFFQSMGENHKKRSKLQRAMHTINKN